jgi:hypothetical protein
LIFSLKSPHPLPLAFAAGFRQASRERKIRGPYSAEEEEKNKMTS